MEPILKTATLLNQKFNVEPPPPMEIVTADGEVILPETSNVEDKIEYDYDKTRSNLHTLLTQGQDALIHALEVAKQSEHPRAFEVVGELMSKLANVNGQLLDLSEKRQKLLDKSKKEVASQPSGNVTNNAFFVGSTTELNKMIQNLSRGE